VPQDLPQIRCTLRHFAISVRHIEVPQISEVPQEVPHAQTQGNQGLRSRSGRLRHFFSG